MYKMLLSSMSCVMRSLVRAGLIFLVGIVITSTMTLFLRSLTTTGVYRGYLSTTNEAGKSIASALTMHDRWETFATLVGSASNISDVYFDDLSTSFLKRYTPHVFLAENYEDAWNIRLSYPPEVEFDTLGIQHFEEVAMCIESMTTSARSRIRSFPKLLNLADVQIHSPDLLYCTPIKTNGSISSFIGIGVEMDDLLATETSIPKLVEDYDIYIRVGGGEDSAENVDIFSTNTDGIEEFTTYTVDLTPNHAAIVSFSAPNIPYWWCVYVFGTVGTIASCLCVFADAKYEQKGDVSRQKSIFLASISHEIRTPMTGIIGMSDLLSLEPDIPEKAVECVRVIGSCSKHLLSLINNVLDLSKIESKQVALSTQVISTSLFHEVVTDTWLMCRRDNGTRMTIAYDNVPLDFDVLGDGLKISQVISNLVTNAVKFTNGGSIRVDVRWEKKVRKNSNVEDAIVVFLRVNDTGIGIPEKSMEKLFKPFAQMTNNNLGQGTGIGLTISRALAVAMGGNLTCSSEENVGSEFMFEFVVVGSFVEEVESVVIGDRLRDTSRSEPPPTVDSISKFRITALIVDDNVVNVKVLKRMLERLSIRCETAEGGHEAISICKSHKFDLIFMDKYMVGLDGIECTRRIRREGRNAETPVFFVSADVSQESKEECMLAGGTAFMSKPVTCAGIEKILSAHGVLGAI